MNLQVRRLSYALGAEIIGADLTHPLPAATFDAIHRAFLEHGVILFRGQEITREQHLAFSRRFGELDRNDAQPRDRDPDYPELLLVTNKPKADGKPGDGTYTGQVWHSDRSYTLIPALGSLLRSVEIPDVGGDTMFANMYRAYETLSDGMRKLIDGLHGVHVGSRKIVDLTPERAADIKKLNPPVAQPLVRTHPETGRKALYVGEKVKQIVGLTPEESQPLLQHLCKHAANPHFVYRHQWRKHDLLMWDNRCMMHKAVGDYDLTQRRHMERATVMGTPSGYVCEDPLQTGSVA